MSVDPQSADGIVQPVFLCVRFPLNLSPVPSPGSRAKTDRPSSLLLIPLVADGLLQYANLAASDNLRRVLTGVLFGVAASVIYKRSALTLLHSLRPATGGSPVRHFHGNLDFAFSSGILLLTIFYSVVVYIV